jgi:hypothetical protein
MKQKKELLLAASECDDPNNLVSHEEAVKEIEKWLNRPVKLTPKQEADLKEAIEETYDPTKLIDHEVVMKKYTKWLK